MAHASPILGSERQPLRDAERLSDAAQALRQIAHHLRQPLSTIEALAYYLSITLPPAETKALDQLEKMQRLVQEANLILSDAVHYFRASRSHPARVDLNELALNALAEMPADDNQPVRFTCGPAFIPVNLDAAQAGHMLRNLAGYLRQVSLGGGVIECAASANELEAELAIGVASAACCPEELASLLDRDSPHLGSGSGLAMASVRRIADAHGGRIGIQAQPPGGMRLTVTFPMATNR